MPALRLIMGGSGSGSADHGNRQHGHEEDTTPVSPASRALAFGPSSSQSATVRPTRTDKDSTAAATTVPSNLDPITTAVVPWKDVATSLSSDAGVFRRRPSLRLFLLGVAVGVSMNGLLSECLSRLTVPAGRVVIFDEGSGNARGAVRRVASAAAPAASTDFPPPQPFDAAVPADKSGPSLTDAMAASFFTLDAATGHILLPESVQQVVIDAGARESDYLRRLVQLNDTSTALILFDPMPHSYIPVAHTSTLYQMRNRTLRWLDETYMNTVFPVRAALSDQEGTAEFNIGVMPACGSLLEFKGGDTPHWCMNSRQKIKAVVLRLESILNLIPPRIRDVHIKIDTEGFDLNVLKGAGLALRRARTVVIECINYKTRDEIPTGTFNCSDAVEYVDTLGAFELVAPPSKGHGENLFWMQSDWTLPPGHDTLPDYFHGPSLIFSSFYGEVEKILQERAYHQ